MVSLLLTVSCGKEKETPHCVQLPPPSGTYRLVDCFNSVSRPYDAYHRLPGQLTDGLRLQPLTQPLAEPFAAKDSLTTLNLVFVYTQSCLPCHWFIKESSTVLPYLHNNDIRFFAVLPAHTGVLTQVSSPLGKLYRDTDSFFTSRLNINGYPLFLLLDSQGRILDYQAGYKQNGASDLLQMLQKWIGN